MRKKLFALCAFITCWGVYAQTPVIEGDVMLCPYTNGTATVTNDVEYDTYQWYSKFWFDDSADFEPIEGATSASFTYDWFTYDQSLFKVVVTLDGQTYESNTIQIDSHNWSPLAFVIEFSEGVVPDDETMSYLICEGDYLTYSIMGEPEDFTNIQWFKDGEAIEGATAATYVANTPGSYHLVASRAVCPETVMSTANNPTVVGSKQGCFLGNEDHELANLAQLYPNPATNKLNIVLPDNTAADNYSIIDVTGKTLSVGSITNSETAIDIDALSSGTYILQVKGATIQSHKMFIKQ